MAHNNNNNNFIISNSARGVVRPAGVVLPSAVFFCVFILLSVVVGSDGGVGVSAGYITYKTCADTIFCSAATCTAQQVPESTCIGAGSAPPGGQTQTLVCSPVEQACGVLGRFSDRFCTVALATQAFVCNQCEKKGSQQIACLRKNGVESLQVSQCAGGDANNHCENCQPAIDVAKNQCVETKDAKSGALVWVKYEGAALCTTITQQIWQGSPTCAKVPVSTHALPVGYCINGTLLSCN